MKDRAYKGEPVAVIKPISIAKKKEFMPIGFGMWAERADLKRVNKWVREKRA